MKTLVKGALVVTPEPFWGDIFIEDGSIRCIGTNLKDPEAEILDARGKIVLPGGVDVHTHMDLDVGFARAADDFYSGTVAAACGGTTSIVDHMGFGPAGAPLHHQLSYYHKLAKGNAVIDYGFHGTVQHVDEEILKELDTMVRDGVPSVKLYLTYGFRMEADEIYRVLVKMKTMGGICAFHCENHELVEYGKQTCKKNGWLAPVYHAKSRPAEAEAEAVERVLRLAHLAGDAPVYIVHLSCKESLQAVRGARRRGQKHIFVETCPQYLLLTEEKYQKPDGLKYIMSPPLRTREDCKALWEGLADGSIQVVATDHCPFSFAKEKQLGAKDFTACPNGAPGVEERMILLYSEGVAKGRISLKRMAEIVSANPAEIYGLSPKKGRLLPGADGDLVILDPKAQGRITWEQMHTAADYTAYEGMAVRGRIEKVLSKGRIVAENGQFLGEKGAGEFLHRSVYSKAAHIGTETGKGGIWNV